MSDTFLMCGEWEESLRALNNEQRGALLSAIFAFHNRGELPQDAPTDVQLAFGFMRPFFERSAKKYEQRSAQNRENGKMGGRPKTQQNPNNPDGFSKTLPNRNPSPNPNRSPSLSLSTEGEGKRAGKPRFIPPTLEEVMAYVAERKSIVEPQSFIDFYAAKGWMVGKTPMKDWKAACRNAEKWERWTRTTASERPSVRPSFAELAAQMEREGKL